MGRENKWRSQQADGRWTQARAGGFDRGSLGYTQAQALSRNDRGVTQAASRETCDGLDPSTCKGARPTRPNVYRVPGMGERRVAFRCTLSSRAEAQSAETWAPSSLTEDD